MRQVFWYDLDGKKHCSMVRDEDSDDLAEKGIPIEPPDTSGVLEEAKVEIHNALVDRGLFTWEDVQRQQNAVTAIVNRAVRNRIIYLFRVKDKADKEAE